MSDPSLRCSDISLFVICACRNSDRRPGGRVLIKGDGGLQQVLSQVLSVSDGRRRRGQLVGRRTPAVLSAQAVIR